jgi:hypothetical protein
MRFVMRDSMVGPKEIIFVMSSSDKEIAKIDSLKGLLDKRLLSKFMGQTRRPPKLVSFPYN